MTKVSKTDTNIVINNKYCNTEQLFQVEKVQETSPAKMNKHYHLQPGEILGITDVITLG